MADEVKTEFNLDEDPLLVGRAYTLACFKVYMGKTKHTNLGYAFELAKKQIGTGRIGDITFERQYAHDINVAMNQVSVRGMVSAMSRVRCKPFYACAKVIIDEEQRFDELGKRVIALQKESSNPDRIWEALLE